MAWVRTSDGWGGVLRRAKIREIYTDSDLWWVFANLTNIAAIEIYLKKGENAV